MCPVPNDGECEFDGALGTPPVTYKEASTGEHAGNGDAGAGAPPPKALEISSRQAHAGPHGSRRCDCGRGIVQDVRQTLGTWWVKEMTNFNFKTVAISFFVYLACIAPAITFGAMYTKLTGGWMGASEMILATAWCGIVYALIGGQPMMINGGTGPVLAFANVIYELSVSLEVPFLTLNAWVGIWVGVYMLVAALVDLNRFIHMCTRFTDEVFAGLISAIFIVNALGSPTSSVGVFHYFDDLHPSHEPYRNVTTPPRVNGSTDSGSDGELSGEATFHGWLGEYSHYASALLAVFLCLGTTGLALRLRTVKAGPWLCGARSRGAVTDFGVVAAVLAFSIIDQLGFPSVQTETLQAPDEFAPTYACCSEACEGAAWPDGCPELAAPWGPRPWLVDITDLNGKWWVSLVAAGPALLAFILVFLDNGITWHLVNRPENKLTHGSAFNYDTVVTGIMIVVNSFLGLPWLVAATVRSINHVQAMSEKDEKGKVTHVQQTRLTHFFIHVLVLVTIFTLQYLRLIPLPVLYGVFLYMGLVSLWTNQFYERVLLLLMQPSRYPKRPYTATPHVPLKELHGFTAVQLFLFGALYVIKSVKSVSIMFPLIIALCIPVRLYLMPKIFSPAALVLIDGDDDEIRAFDGGAAAARKKRRSDIDSNPPSMYPSALGGDAPPALTLAPAVSPRETERARETSLGLGYQDGDASMTASAHHAV